MALTDDLISQFVKITNDKKDVKEETTVYGTIKKKDGRTFVQLDGASDDEILTPVTEAASANDGERVTVMIKNHTAIVTGNLSSPLARSGDVDDANATIHEFGTVLATKVSTEDLETERARIDVLEADNATIKGLLEANDIDVGKLQADYVTVNKSLTAVQASVENLETTKLDADIANATYATITELEATNADIHNLESTYGDFEVLTTNKFSATDASIKDLQTNYAKIEDLNATNAEIDTLQADMADIDTLIFGSASGTTIQTSFANAVIAQLGDAQIKSAMIESVSANKMTTGDIITNKVRVKSQNGLLLISDETIQISDNTRVRVQIGKDAANDYSINVWDAEGNLMFSKGGITDSAIKDSIIRNDMVSDTANIAAHKLDIDSLFEEINGSTNTIKSTQIYLDDEKQTLDVAFKELDTTVTNMGTTVSSQGTQIAAIQGQISSKVWQQDIDTATNEMSTQYSALEQEVDSISATVASHTSQIASKADSSAVTTVSYKVTSLETDLEGVKTTVASNTSEISKKADSSTVTEVNNKITSLEADVDGFKTTVSSTYATKTDVAAIDIGGRNILWNTNFNAQLINTGSGQYWTQAANTKDATEVLPTGYLGKNVVHCINDTTDTTYDFLQQVLYHRDNGIEKRYVDGDQYTLSFYIKGAGTVTTYIYPNMGNNGNERIADGVVQGTEFNDHSYSWMLTDEWTRHTYTANLNDTLGDSRVSTSILFRLRPSSEIYVCMPQLEKGNKATDYKEAIEDTNLDITKLSDRVTSSESSINQLSDSISTNVTETDKLKTRMSTVEQTASGLTVSLEETNTKIDNIEIGGRNLYAGSSDFSGTWINSDGWFADGTDSVGNAVVKRVRTWSGISQYIKAKAGEKYVLSANVRGDGSSTAAFYVTERDDSYADIVGACISDNPVAPTVETRIHSDVYTVKNDCNLHFRIENSISDATLWISSLKLERGNKATDWTPAPEDMATVTKLESEIKVASDSITSTVSEKYATKQEVSDIEVGGRNLLLNTGNDELPVMSNGAEYTYSAGLTSFDSSSGVLSLTYNAAGSEVYYRFMTPSDSTNNLYGLEPGKAYTFSGKAQVTTTSGTLDKLAARVQNCSGTSGWQDIVNEAITWTDTSDWIDFAVTFIIDASATGCYVSVQLYYVGSWAGSIKLKNLQLEKGTMATDWSPAPDDIQNEVNSLETRVVSTETSITQLSDKIVANVGSIDSLGSRMTTVEQTASGLTVSLEETNTKIDTLEIGGRNLLLNTKNFVGTNIAGSATIVTETYKDLSIKKYDNAGDTTNSKDIVQFKQIYAENFGDQYTLSFYAKGSGTLRTYFYGATGYTPCIKTEQSDGSKSMLSDGSSPWTMTDTWTRYWVTWTLGTDGDISVEKYILFRLAGGAVASICGAKLEKGNKATDWTPAPEDVQSGIDDATKTATNYLHFSNSGLVVGDMTASTLGKNVLIDSDSVDIRNGESVLASFGAKEVTLGQNAEDSVINLCDGAATIKALISESSDSYPAYDSMQLDSQKIVMNSQKTNIDTAASGSSWENSAHMQLLSQSSIGNANAVLKSKTTVIASGNNSSTGVLAQSSSKLASTYTKIYSDFEDVTNGVTTSNSMRMYPNNTIFDQPIVINGTYYRGTQNVLWSGGYYMTETHTITLSESVLTQPTGIVLIFSRYADGAAQNNNYNHFFVPKEFISSNSGVGSEFTMMSNGLAEACHKYLYITDTTIRGHATNDATGTGASGITYANNKYVLRRVVGV